MQKSEDSMAECRLKMAFGLLLSLVKSHIVSR